MEQKNQGKNIDQVLCKKLQASTRKALSGYRIVPQSLLLSGSMMILTSPTLPTSTR